jgi:probable H4MPT-linked C1 transfer pathway protein
MIVIGWDLGGAHVKAARIENGRVTGAVQVACPLWQGLDRLDAAFAEIRRQLGEAEVNAVTMTGELSDIFASRAEGVGRLSAMAATTLPGPIRVYGGREGWLDPGEAGGRADAVASANWHATATLAARCRAEALLVDMGSTTTDIIPIAGGRPAGRGYTDAERLAASELVYTGATRTFLMAVAQRVPFRGGWTSVMNEYFASMADVHRILGALPPDADQHPAADGRDKSVAASCARLARMVGCDAAEASEREWRDLAGFYAEAQLRTVHDAALQVLSASALADDAPVVAAGVGRFVIAKLAQRLGRSIEPWEAGVPARPEIASLVDTCAPAVAVGLLLSAAQGSPP